ncbi:MAG: DUF4912 domain-containing protein [Pseudomonadota bacterium]
MKKSMLDKIPDTIIRALAREKGYLSKGGESIDDVRRWLVRHYRKGVEEIIGKGENIVEVANDTLKRVKSMFSVPTQETRAEEEIEEKTGSEAFSTATMAKIYEKQGLIEEAAAVYERLLEKEPGNGKWREALLGLKERAAAPGSVEDKEDEKKKEPRRKEAMEGEGPGAEEKGMKGLAVGGNTISPSHVTSQEPYFLLDMEELPPSYGRNTMVIMPVGPEDLYTYWEVTKETLDGTLTEAGFDAKLVLRLFEVSFNEQGMVETRFRDEAIGELLGDFFIHGVKPGGFYRFALGLKSSGAFFPMVHSKLEATPATAGSMGNEEFLEVDQKALLWRGRDLRPLKQEKKSGLSLHERALLRLHLLDRYEASRLSGLSEDRLEELFDSIRELTGDVKRSEASSSLSRWE